MATNQEVAGSSPAGRANLSSDKLATPRSLQVNLADPPHRPRWRNAWRAPSPDSYTGTPRGGVFDASEALIVRQEETECR